MAGDALAAVEQAARLGDWRFTNPHAPIVELAELKARYDELREGDTEVLVLREVFVAETTEEARETPREYLEPKYK